MTKVNGPVGGPTISTSSMPVGTSAPANPPVAEDRLSLSRQSAVKSIQPRKGLPDFGITQFVKDHPYSIGIATTGLAIGVTFGFLVLGPLGAAVGGLLGLAGGALAGGIADANLAAERHAKASNAGGGLAGGITDANVGSAR